jgi:hypothetical protein
VDTRHLYHLLLGIRSGRGERQKPVDSALCIRAQRDRSDDSGERVSPTGRQSAGAVGIELARRAEAEGFGWCRLLTHWRSAR